MARLKHIIYMPGAGMQMCWVFDIVGTQQNRLAVAVHAGRGCHHCFDMHANKRAG